MIAQRIKKLIEILEISQRQFAMKISINPSYLSRMLQGDREINERTLMLIENIFNVNSQWLRTGEGEIFKDSNTSSIKKQVLELIDTLDESQVEAVSAFLKYLQQEQKYNLHK